MQVALLAHFKDEETEVQRSYLNSLEWMPPYVNMYTRDKFNSSIFLEKHTWEKVYSSHSCNLA